MTNNRNFKVQNNMLASGGQRFANYILDILVIYAIIFVLLIGLGIILALFGYEEFFFWMENISDLESYLIFFGIYIPYFTFLEGYFSRSVAKYITRTIVVMEDGSKPDYGTTFRRTLCRIIPFDQFSYLGSNHRGWHDSISDTYVVDKQIFDSYRKQFYELDEIGKNEENQ